MRKREYERILCEVLVTLLFKGHYAVENANLLKALSMGHPERESAFVAWAVENVESNSKSLPIDSKQEQEERV